MSHLGQEVLTTNGVDRYKSNLVDHHQDCGPSFGEARYKRLTGGVMN